MAGVSLGSLLYLIKASNSGFKSVMNSSKKIIKDFDGQVKSSKKELQDWTSKAKQVGVVATAVFAGVASAGLYFLKAASDAQEMQNVLEVSFGSMSNDINKWAEDTASAVNRSDYQMKNFVSTAMAMTSSMVDTKDEAAEMARTISQLAVDLGSFRNISDERAFEALTAALTGEAEALKRLGYNVQEGAVKQYALNQSIEKSFEKMTLAEKTTLRYKLILERLNYVMGDAERTSGSYANQLKGFQGEIRNLREEWGKYLLPTATKVVGVFRSLVKFINDLPAPLKEISANGMVIVGIMAGIAGPLGLIIGYLPQLKTGLAMVQGAFTPFLVGGAIIIGLITIFNYFKRIRDEAELVKRDVSRVSDLVEAEKQLAAIDKALADLEKSKEWKKGNDETVKSWGGQYGRMVNKANDQDPEEEKYKAEREALEKQRELTQEKVDELRKVEAVLQEEQAILETMREKRSQMIIKEITKDDYLNFLQEQVDNEKWSTETRAQFQLELEAALAASEEEITTEYEKHAQTRAEIEKEYQNKRALFGKEGLERELTEIEQQKQAEISRAEEAKMSAEKIAEIEQYWDNVKLAKKQEYKDKTLELEADYLNKLDGLRGEELRSELDTLKAQKEDSLITEEEYRDQVKLIRQEMLDLELANIEYQKQKEMQAAQESGSGDAIAGIEEYYQTMAAAAIQAYLDIEAAEERQRQKAENGRVALAGENRMQYQYEQGDISSDVYIAHLKAKLEEAKTLYGEWSDEYMGILAQINEEEKKAADEKDQVEERKKRIEENRLQWQYEQGEKSKADYLEHLQKKLADAEEWSDDYIAILQEIQQVEGEIADDSKTNWQLFLKELYAEVQDHPIIQLFSNMGFQDTKLGQIFANASEKLGGMVDNFFSNIFGKGNWVGILLDIVKQTKSFTLAMKILNAFMQPFIGLVDLVLLPLLKFIANLWNAVMDGLSSISILGWKPFKSLKGYKIDLGDEEEQGGGEDDGKDSKPTVNGSQITNLTGASRNFLTDLLRPWRDLTTININIDYIRRSVADIASILKAGNLAPVTPVAASPGGESWNIQSLVVNMYPLNNTTGYDMLRELGEIANLTAELRGQK